MQKTFRRIERRWQADNGKRGISRDLFAMDDPEYHGLSDSKLHSTATYDHTTWRRAARRVRDLPLIALRAIKIEIKPHRTSLKVIGLIVGF